MEHLITPGARFEGLPDFPFEPRFVDVEPGPLPMHYIDEGPRDGEVVLMLHGEPTWSYLYRFMIPRCVEAGHRVVAPDLIGFGRSAKPLKITDHSYERQCSWVRSFIEGLDLKGITLVGQDWGSLIGLRLAAEVGSRFSRIVIGNGFLPANQLPRSLKVLPQAAAFLTWRTFARFSPVFPTSRIVDLASQRPLSADERRAYDAPFPDKRYKAGARALPALVPISPRDPALAANKAAWAALGRWDKPFLTTFSDGDPIMRGLDEVLRAHIPGSRGLPHQTLSGGHFLQEDSGPAFAEAVNRLIEDTR